MATLVLAAAGSAIGGAVGGSILGIGAAAIGQAVGGFLGSQIDAALSPGLPPTIKEGPRLQSLDTMTSQAGAPMAWLAGRAAIAGEVIWASRIREDVALDVQQVGSGKSSQTVIGQNYVYSVSFAVGLCEGVISHVGRIWLDGKLADLSELRAAGKLRIYYGTETQNPDYIIEATEGSAPAFRGLAYIVFQDLPLGEFGNRIPQVRAEIYGPKGVMERDLRGVCIIPGTTETGYDPVVNNRVTYNSLGEITSSIPDNAARWAKTSDWTLAIDTMQGTLPGVDTASLVVAHFGTDLRAGQCDIIPKVEVYNKELERPWSSRGLTRQGVPQISQVNGKPAFGSAPSDASVIAAIKDLKARGLRVVLYPFIMMDVQASQGLPDPSGSGVQPDYPWRGRIAPAAGQNITSEINGFCDGQWGFDNFILHLASLAAQAGGVDAFLIGSELRGLTMARDGNNYPFVDRLKSLAGQVRGILGAGTKISYAADWSEYHSDRNGGDVRFHLDPLWADPDIDFVGIDNYLPLADWREGSSHLDAQAGYTSIYDLDYLRSNIEGGEYWDWYYADDAARASQTRSPIPDGFEDWVFRQKAIRDWHAEPHHDRPGGVRNASATAWVPGSKPIWFTELGCPSVNKGANQPNVFVSRNSSESFLPYFSTGTRDDFMQRQFLRAWHEWLEDTPGPVDPANVQVWAWDARPWPEFPQRSNIWADGPDWMLGHWLTGRAGAAPVAEAASRRLAMHGWGDYDLTAAYGQMDGYATPGPITFREWLSPIEVGIGVQAYETGGTLFIEAREAAPTLTALGPDDMATGSDLDRFSATRDPLETVAQSAIFNFRDGLGDYEVAAARAVIEPGPEAGIARADSPLVLDFDRGNAACERLLRAAAGGREVVRVSLPRSITDLRPGAILPLDLGAGVTRLYSVEAISEGADLEVELRSFDRGAWGASGGVDRGVSPGAPVRASSALIMRVLDLPIIGRSDREPWDGFAALHAQPWPGSALISRSADLGASWTGQILAPAPATMGETKSILPPAPPWRWQAVDWIVESYGRPLIPRPRAEVLSGANRLAIKHPSGGWEIIGFSLAEPLGGNQWRILEVIRGLRGTDPLAETDLPINSDFVAVDAALTPLNLDVSDIGQSRRYRYGAARDDVASHATTDATVTGVGLLPFAPAHLRAADQSGDLVISWTRRSRAAVETLGDTPSDPPLAEGSERYRVEIGPEGAPVRVIETTTTSATYTAAQIATDGLTAPYRIAVAQISDDVGPGRFAQILMED